MTELVPTCPECGSTRIWKDGTRQKEQGKTQRYLCRECSYRFSKTNLNCSNEPKQNHRMALNMPSSLLSNRQISVTQTKGAKNLVKVETRTEKQVAGASKYSGDIKSKLFEFAWWMKKQGYKQSTINKYPEVLKTMAGRQVNIFDPESVKEGIAKQETLSRNSKHLVVNIIQPF